MAVHAYNLSYSGNRSRRIESLKPPWAKLVRPYFKNKIRKRGLGSWFKW
jgi:hypothetical protein